jgi:hypothetical protein
LRDRLLVARGDADGFFFLEQFEFIAEGLDGGPDSSVCPGVEVAVKKARATREEQETAKICG